MITINRENLMTDPWLNPHGCARGSDLTFFLTGALGACDISDKYLGKRASLATMDKANEHDKAWLVVALLDGGTNIGLSKKDCEELWRAIRDSITGQVLVLARKNLEGKELAHIEKECRKAKVTWANVHKFRVTFNEDDSHLSDSLLCDLVSLEDMELDCFNEVEFPHTQTINKLIVRLVRKSMKKLGLSPDSTKIYEGVDELPKAA